MEKDNYSSIFVISDIHGCATELKLLLNKLPLDKKSLVVFLGDYIDRGPASKEVIDTILDLQKRYEVVPLMGNHEKMLLDFLKDPTSAEAGMFIYNGGGATLASYKIDNTDHYVIPKEHLAFYSSLRKFHQTEKYFFVHAGVPDLSIEMISDEDSDTLLWIREDFFYSDYRWEKLIVHGHTPANEVEITERRMNIDTGCVFNNKLTAIELPERKVYSVTKQKKAFHVYLKDESGISSRRSVRYTGSIPVYVHSDDSILKFETINYNEHGMLIIDLMFKNKIIFQEDQMVRGTIGDSSHETIRFEGVVVRAEKNDKGVFYALKFDKTPFNLMDNPLER